MSQTIDITPHELSIVLQVLKLALPKDSKVWVFGSRAKHSARHNSDLDLAIDAGQPLDNTARMVLQMGFEEAHLPYTVDTVDMQTVEPYFKEIIEQQQKPLPGWGNVPELRFPEFEGEWEGKKGAELFKSRRERGNDSLPIYSVTQGNGLVPRDSLDRKMEADAASEQNLKVCPNDIVYNMMRMWQGAIGLANTDCMVSPAYIVLKATNLASPNFFNYMFKRSRPLYDLWAYSYGLTDDRLRLYYKDFSRIPFPVPKPNEQQKIANFLSSVDAKLAKLSRKKTLLEDYKRGLMQQIFSQKIRFKQDDGNEFPEWEKVLLGNLFTERSEKSDGDNELLSVTMNEGVVKRSDIGQKDSSSEDKSNYKKVYAGDIAYNSMRMWQGASGLSNYDGIVSPAYTVVTPISSVFPMFFAYFFKYQPVINLFRRYSQGLTSDTWNLKFPAFSKIIVFIPESKEEQQKIADFLSLIDQKIDVVAKQIEQLEAFKKGLLQKLFV